MDQLSGDYKVPGRPWYSLWLDYFFTPTCPGCLQVPGYRFCNNCRQSLAPLRLDLGNFTSIFAAGSYRGPLRRSILNYKRWGYKDWTRLLVYHIYLALPKEEFAGAPTWCIPIPASFKRRWQRGYNTPDFLAKELTSFFDNFIYYPQGLKVVGEEQPPQKHSRRLDRFIQASQRYRATGVRGHSVLLVDDVSTSGATLYSAATSLYEAGAVRVDCAVIGLVIDGTFAQEESSSRQEVKIRAD